MGVYVEILVVPEAKAVSGGQGNRLSLLANRVEATP
jgi:hypothetical protein